MKLLYNGKAIIVGLDYFNPDNYPKLEVVGCNCTGTDHLPWEQLKKRNIKVISLKGETEFLKNITSTAEHTIGLIIALLRNYKTAFYEPYQDREFYKGYTLRNKIIGIIGYGRVGKQVGAIAVNLRMNVIFQEKKFGYGLNDLLKKSDIVSLHIPLENNEGFFNKKMFEIMKPTAYLINSSRSSIINEKDLLEALKKKRIAGAAIDFIDNSNLIKYAKIHNNLILTNHLGGCTFEDMAKTKEFIEKKVGEEIKNLNKNGKNKNSRRKKKLDKQFKELSEKYNSIGQELFRIQGEYRLLAKIEKEEFENKEEN